MGWRYLSQAEELVPNVFSPILRQNGPPQLQHRYDTRSENDDRYKSLQEIQGRKTSKLDELDKTPHSNLSPSQGTEMQPYRYQNLTLGQKMLGNLEGYSSICYRQNGNHS